MRRASKMSAAALVALLLAIGLIACGGGDDSDSSTTDVAAQQSEGAAGGDDSQGEGANGTSDGGDSGSGDGSSGAGESSGPPASDFTPRQHNDSGGGSTQFKVKGGDNSVQEFGEEADAEEFDAAAVALHNFLDARAESNWAAACEYMSAAIVESFEKLAEQAKQIDDTSCAGVLEKLTNPAAKQAMQEEADKANVGSLRIEDERAFVIYTAIDGTVMAMPMENEGGEWKVGSLAGTPLS